MVAIRLTEVFGVGIQTPLRTPATLSMLIKIQEEGGWVIPIDHYTDCRDLFQLVVGEKGVPQDRYQRLYILSLREDRIKGTIRYFLWKPTAAMIADALTKVMICPNMYDLITHGYWRWKCIGPQGQEQKPLVALALQHRLDYSEEDLINLGKTGKPQLINLVTILSSTTTITGTSSNASHLCSNSSFWKPPAARRLCTEPFVLCSLPLSSV